MLRGGGGAGMGGTQSWRGGHTVTRKEQGRKEERLCLWEPRGKGMVRLRISFGRRNVTGSGQRSGGGWGTQLPFLRLLHPCPAVLAPPGPGSFLDDANVPQLSQFRASPPPPHTPPLGLSGIRSVSCLSPEALAAPEGGALPALFPRRQVPGARLRWHRPGNGLENHPLSYTSAQVCPLHPLH